MEIYEIPIKKSPKTNFYLEKQMFFKSTAQKTIFCLEKINKTNKTNPGRVLAHLRAKTLSELVLLVLFVFAKQKFVF